MFFICVIYFYNIQIIILIRKKYERYLKVISHSKRNEIHPLHYPPLLHDNKLALSLNKSWKSRGAHKRPVDSILFSKSWRGTSPSREHLKINAHGMRHGQDGFGGNESGQQRGEKAGEEVKQKEQQQKRQHFPIFIKITEPTHRVAIISKAAATPPASLLCPARFFASFPIRNSPSPLHFSLSRPSASTWLRCCCSCWCW